MDAAVPATLCAPVALAAATAGHHVRFQGCSCGAAIIAIAVAMWCARALMVNAADDVPDARQRPHCGCEPRALHRAIRAIAARSAQPRDGAAPAATTTSSVVVAAVAGSAQARQTQAAARSICSSPSNGSQRRRAW